MIDHDLKRYATETQWLYYNTVEELGVRAAAKHLDIDPRGLQRAIKRMKDKAAQMGWSPDNDLIHHQAHNVAGVSTYYEGVEGVHSGQWVKTKVEKAKPVDRMLEALPGILGDIKPLPKVKARKNHVADLLTLYTLTDYHLGQYSMEKETGEPWDMEIAAETMSKNVEAMVTQSPDSEDCILNIMGDFIDFDGLVPETPNGKNVMDASGRYSEIVDLAIRLVVDATNRLLAKHKHVNLLVCEGNHDESGALWLRKCVKHMFSKNDRVTVNDTDFPFYAYLHGKIMLGFHHGHKKKNAALPGVFSTEPRYRSMWGQANYTYIHTGHYHRVEQDAIEGGGAIVERHPTLAARDAYATRLGLYSWRAARAITYDKLKGETVRVSVYE